MNNKSKNLKFKPVRIFKEFKLNNQLLMKEKLYKPMGYILKKHKKLNQTIK
jgi:hypothetical protein